MDIWGAIKSGIDVTVNAVASVTKDICATIGGAVMNGVSKFVVAFPGLGLAIEAVRTIIGIVTEVAKYLIDRPETESPEELGKKAEICQQEEGLTPEDFESVDAYIEHLRNDIQVDKEKLEAMDWEQRFAYASIGAGLYVRAMEERYSIRMEPEFWRALQRTRFDTDRVPELINSMKSAGVESGKLLDSYLAGTLPAGSAEQQNVINALTSYSETLGLNPGKEVLALSRSYNNGVENR